MKDKKNRNIKNIDFLIVVLLFTISTAIRTLLAWKNAEIFIFWDELINWDISKSIHEGFETAFHGDKIIELDALYSLYISICHFISSAKLQYWCALLLNSIAMSSVVFPVYLLTKRLELSKLQMYIVLIFSVAIPEMLYTCCIMQENLMYPMAIWFLTFSLYVLDNLKKRFLIVLWAVFSLLMYTIKDIGLSFGAAVAIFLFFAIFISKKRKDYIITFTIYCGSFAILYLLYKFAISRLIYTGASADTTQALVTGTVANAGLVTMLIRVIYPIATYFMYFITFIGVLPVLIPITSWNRMCEKDKKLMGLSLSILFVLIGVTCAIVSLGESPDSTNIRIHFRYIFYMQIPFVLLFLKYLKKYRFGREALLFLMIYAVMLRFVNIISVTGSPVDEIVGRWLSCDSTEYGQRTFYVVLFIIIAIVGYLLMHNKKVCAFLVWAVAITSMYLFTSTELYAAFHEQKLSSKDMREELYEINDYIDGEDTLVVGENEFYTFYIEARLDTSYSFMLREDLLSSKECDFLYGATCRTNQAAYIWNKKENPQFVISKDKLNIDGYSRVDIGKKFFHLYELDGSKVNWYSSDEKDKD